MSKSHKLDQKWYPEFQDEWDARAFRERVLEAIKPTDVLLDIGAGRGGTPHMNFKKLVAKVIGTDVDEAIKDNTQIDVAVYAPDGSLTGVEDNSVDIVVSKDVLEHVATPEKFFDEVNRVLKPGGIFMAKTPNVNHYMPLIARLTPLSFHKYVNKKRGRETFDTFPTTYLCNTRRSLKKWADRGEMELVYVDFQEGRPEYLRFNALTYFIGFCYERLVNGLKLHGIKSVLYVKMKKPEST